MTAIQSFTLPLLTMTLLFAATACTAIPKPQAAQADAKAAIETLGGQVKVDKTAPDQPVIAVNLSDIPITDASLACLNSLPHLQAIDLGHTKKLARPTITDAGLTHLKGLSHLQSLNLDGTKITDAGMTQLAALTQFRTLKLRDTTITDAGLMYLSALHQLQTLNLEGANVTPPAVRMLRRALPDCQITR